MSTLPPTKYSALEKDNTRRLLYQLARSNHLWSQRVAIVATLHFIKRDDFGHTLRLSQTYLTHQHDLIHKATGWMLREIGNRDEKVLCAFLDKHHESMPRTMLRYAIERLDPPLRTKYLGR